MPRTRVSPGRRVLLALLLIASLLALAPGTDRQRIPLAEARWTLDGAESALPGLVGAGASTRVRLPVRASGQRWATQFETARPGTFRLVLEWQPGPDGLLFEILLDGERQPPPRDGWRPTSRALRTDLGSRWLGDGQHLLEFIAREEVAAGALELGALDLERIGDG